MGPARGGDHRAGAFAEQGTSYFQSPHSAYLIAHTRSAKGALRPEGRIPSDCYHDCLRNTNPSYTSRPTDTFLSSRGQAFLLIGGADSGVAALAETNIATAMRKIYEQREACSKTLANTAGLVRNVGRLLSTLLGIIAVFVSLGIFRVDVANLWLVFSSGSCCISQIPPTVCP